MKHDWKIAAAGGSLALLGLSGPAQAAPSLRVVDGLGLGAPTAVNLEQTGDVRLRTGECGGRPRVVVDPAASALNYEYLYRVGRKLGYWKPANPGFGVIIKLILL